MAATVLKLTTTWCVSDTDLQIRYLTRLRLCVSAVFQRVFSKSTQSNWQFITKPINCEQKTLWLSKEKYLFSQELDLYFNGLYFNDSTVYFSIGFPQLTAAVKLVPLHPHDREYILVKAANARIF